MDRTTKHREEAIEQTQGEAVQAAQRRARSAQFVGRERELRLFAETLASGEAPRIVFVHGQGGIGKSSLLGGFRDAAERRGVAFAHLDARLLPAVPDAVSQAVQGALAHRGHSKNGALQVIALDHAEQLAALDGWLRGELIPGLPANTILIIAGRQRPGPAWRADPGLHDLLVDLELRPLEPDAVSAYLQRRGVPDAQRDAVRHFAHGHPLALALATDQALRAPAMRFDGTGGPDLIQDLAGWLLHDVDDPSHRQALAACATVRQLSEPLLAAMLGRDNARAEFDWLAEQHFVEPQANGLMIHDLMREVVVSDLRARDLAGHRELLRRAAAYVLAGLETAGQYATLQAVGDMIYAMRHEPYIQHHFPFGDAQYYPDAARPEEHPALTAEVARLEGAESAGWFEAWLAREDTQLIVMRDSAREPGALATLLRFGADDLARGSDDPCVQALFDYLRERNPLRCGERVLLMRFVMAHGSHQKPTPAWANLTAQLNGFMFESGISLLAFVSDLARDWEGTRENAEADLLPGTEYRIGGRHYALTGVDLRREPPLEWARNSVERILRDGQAPALHPTDPALLDRSAFADAVVHVLHAFHDEAALAGSPLLRSPMLRRYAARRDPESLRRLIRDTSLAQLSEQRRQCTLHAVLERVYFRPSNAKQHAAAVDLNISERTLRRRLREAEARLVEALWRLETGEGR